MKNIWKVSFDTKYTHCKEWMEETVTVVANGDGQKAVTKAKRYVIGMSFTDTRDVVGDVECKCVAVRLTALQRIGKVDAL